MESVNENKLESKTILKKNPSAKEKPSRENFQTGNEGSFARCGSTEEPWSAASNCICVSIFSEYLFIWEHALSTCTSILLLMAG